MHRIQALLLSALALGITVAAQAADPQHGQALYEENCTGCHGTEIHTRADSIIYSYAALKNRIAFCESMAGAGWSEQDFADVAAYLNQEFYKFDEQ